MNYCYQRPCEMHNSICVSIKCSSCWPEMCNAWKMSSDAWNCMKRCTVHTISQFSFLTLMFNLLGFLWVHKFPTTCSRLPPVLSVRTLSIFHQLTWFFLMLAEHISVSEKAEEFVLMLQYYWVYFAGVIRLILEFW